MINLNLVDSIFYLCEIFYLDGCWDNYFFIDECKFLKKKKLWKLLICIIKYIFVKYKWVLEDWCEVFFVFYYYFVWDREIYLFFDFYFFFGFIDSKM